MMMHHGPTRRTCVAAFAGLIAAIAGCGGASSDDSFGGAATTSQADGAGDDSTTGAPTTSGSSDTSSTSTTDDTDTAAPTTSTGPVCESDDDCKDDPAGPLCSGGHCTTPCAPGDTRACYTGPDGSLDVGPCRRGEETCSADGLTWSDCVGEVVPAAVDECANAVDDDCDGAVDDDDDADGDGFGVCSGDCCDADSGACFDAMLVNPGAVEYVGNAVDDDCDGDVDEAAETCDAGLASGASDPLDYARALDLCTFTTLAPADPKDRTWGVISAKLSLADGTGLPAPESRSIRPGFGTVISAVGGERLAVLSSGHAADALDINPPFAAFEGGKDMNTTSPPPADWLDANQGTLPNPDGCAAPAVPAANDAVMLTLEIRAPTNAKSFAASMYFFSAEYPEWVCSNFNDFFVALVDSQAAGNPADKNVAVYDDGATKWPIGVNLALVADGLFRQCDNGPVGCAVDETANYLGCEGTAELAGTGFDAFDDFACDASQDHVGGGTGWLTLRGNVEPGEVVTVRLAVWDSGGHIFDSTVLLDAWEWSVDPAKPGVTPG
jgi:hypothetical protein